MRRVAALALAVMTTAAVASAQKIMMPTQTSNPNVKIVPAAPQTDLSKAKRIPREEAVKLVKQGKAIFVDVRPKESYDYGHIKGALSIPEAELIGRLKEIPPGRMIVTYCA